MLFLQLNHANPASLFGVQPGSIQFSEQNSTDEALGLIRPLQDFDNLSLQLVEAHTRDKGDPIEDWHT